MGAVKSFKLVDGNEIVAEVTEAKTQKVMLTEQSPNGHELKAEVPEVTAYVLRKPYALTFQQMGGGQVGLALIPWLMSNPGLERIELPAASVLVTFDPSPNVERQYLEQTSSIAIAPAGARISK